MGNDNELAVGRKGKSSLQRQLQRMIGCYDEL